jgi:DNA-binding SARP family transcriptional activator
LAVHLLGPTRASVDDRPVESWLSGRGRAVFEYLTMNRQHATPRERLMSIFWPDASPDGARNCLNVAIHGLRQSLRTAAGEQPIVIHRNRSYLIEPSVEVWLDVEAFEHRLKSAQHHLVTHELSEAENDLDAAVGLYQGEFLADDPYEEWAIVAREHLRLAYLDALDQLGALRFDSGNYGGAAELCLKTLAYDNCREDAHCRLMRCYSRKGQPQLALRQYHACVAILRSELRMEPSATTTDLFQRIQRRDDV